MLLLTAVCFGWLNRIVNETRFYIRIYMYMKNKFSIWESWRAYVFPYVHTLPHRTYDTQKECLC